MSGRKHGLNPIKKESLREKALKIFQSKHAGKDMDNAHDLQEVIEELNINKIELELQNDELQESRQDLAEAKTRYFELFDIAPFGYFIYDYEYKIKEVNSTGSEFLKTPKKNLVGTSIHQFIAPESQDEFYFHVKDLKKTRKKATCIIKIYNKNQQELYVKVESRLQENGNDQPLILSTLLDITRQIKIERSLRDKEEKFRLITSNSSALIWELDLEGKFIFVNDAFKHKLGYKPGDIINKKLYDFLQASDKAGIIQKLQEIRDTKSISINKIRFKTARGDYSVLKCLINHNVYASGSETIIMVCEDITEQIKNRERLKRSEFLYRTFARNMPGTDFFLFGKDMEFILADGTEMAKHGLKKENLEGNNLFEYAHVENFQLLLDFFKKAMKGERASKEFMAKNEHFLIQVMPLKNEYNKIFAGLAIITNITQSKKTQEDLTRAKNLAIEASEAKTSFLANMSHEIRTPLTAIIGFSEQLEKTDLDDNQRKFNNYIRNSSQHLFGLVNDILILSKIGIGKFNISKKPFNIRNTIEDVYHSQLFDADQKNIDFTVVIDDKVANRLLGDSIRIKQVLINLTNNAIKFTKKGKVDMNCKVIGESDKSQILLFQVIDTGIGIPSEKQDEVFSEFTQVDGAINRKYGGSGLGLTICKKLTDLMDGTIDFESHPGKGTTFNFTLNLEKVQHEDFIDDGIDDIDISKKIPPEIDVLLVDDDEMNRALGEIILTKFNIKITTAVNGRQALEISSKRKFDLVLLDIQMPEISGLDVTREIRSNREGLNKDTPIIAVTANSLQSEVVKYFEAGMNDYLLKPFHEKELLLKIMTALNIDEEIKLTKKDNRENSGVPVKKSPLFSLENLEKDTLGNAEIKKKMLNLFIQNAKEHNENLGSNLEEKNYKKLGEICHKMVPSYKHMEAMSIVEKLTHVEEITLRSPNFDGVEETVEEIIEENKQLIKALNNISL